MAMAEISPERRSVGHRGKVAPRSTIEWGVRIGLSALATLVGLIGVTFSLAQVVAGGDPATAHRLAPYDGRITALLARNLFRPEMDTPGRARVADLARRALRQDPTAVTAIPVLGLDAQLRGDIKTTRRWFHYGENLSRRDLPIQLWAIEDAVTRGDIGDVLNHYDIALKTRPSSAELLFPVLAPASLEPAIRAALIGKLRDGPRWGQNFIDYVSSNSDPIAASSFFQALGNAGVIVPRIAKARVVNALIATGQAERAWQYYAARYPGADRRHSRDPRFTNLTDTPSVLDWVLSNDSAISTSLQQNGNNRVLSFLVPGSVGGQVLQQYQLLLQGKYRLEGLVTATVEAAVPPYWLVSCKNGREFGRIIMPLPQQGSQRFSGSFVIPDGCPIQTLTLIARSNDTVTDIAGEIGYVMIKPE